MHRKRKYWIVIIVLIIAIKIFAAFPYAVERYYSNGIYIFISRTQRFLFGWIPFSVGDILYAAVVIYLIVKLVRLIRAIIKRQTGKGYWIDGLSWSLFWSLWIYIVFNVLWGLNYNRLGVAYQSQLNMAPYSTKELTIAIEKIIERLNETDSGSLVTRDIYLNKKNLFNGAYKAYGASEQQHAFLSYKTSSIKPSLFSYLGDYFGYTGYYNPFTGEAQVNTTVPAFVRPFTTCHEVGHQLGYAKENEANFAGYLSATSSHDAAFRYSVYFDLYLYGIRELYYRDSTIAKSLHAPVQVKKDYAALMAFYDSYQNPIEPYIRRLYAQYLRANQQPSGMQSYSEVMAFLIAYYKKFGKI